MMGSLNAPYNENVGCHRSDCVWLGRYGYVDPVEMAMQVCDDI